MANRAGKKGKKPLQTTLGKATSQNEKEVDLSHVQKPIHTSIFGLRQVLSLFQTATEEVQNYITHECDIMYECRACRTIFRSLANFILHKRNYCRERFNHLELLNNNEINQENQCTENTQQENNGELSSFTTNPKDPTLKVGKNLAPVIEKLKKKQEIHQLAQEALNADLSLKEAEDNSNKSHKEDIKNNDMLLETIATNNAAVFQTIVQNLPTQPFGKSEYMKSEVMEIHGILESDEAVIGPDGKICNFETNKVNENPLIPKGDLFCTECNLKFSTKKTLTYHIKYKHNHTRLVYVCPDCKDTFANAWCVYRHLYKIHRRTTAQIKRMREQIHNSCVRKDQEPAKKKDKKKQEKVDKTDEENQWLNNIEGDNDFQMCGGCGKRFERKAALHSHAQMCTKRIAVCNTIKENNAKKKEEECKENKNKIVKGEKSDPLYIPKGSMKRKPYLLRTYKPSDKHTTHEVNTISPQEVCDVNANCEINESNCDNEETEGEGKLSRIMSPSTEDLYSPRIKDACASPSVDKIDTEKMLNIIGVTSISENLSVENDDSEISCSKEELNEKVSHTVNDFNLFCQNIAEELVTSMPEEKEGCCQKASRTVPLILRRKNSPRSEKRNTILDQINDDSLVISSKQDGNKTNDDLSKNNVIESEDIEIMNKTHELESSPSTSSFRINVKNLEDLIGVSTENHIKYSEVENIVSDSYQETDFDVHSTSNMNTDHSKFTEVSDTIRANVSPEKLQKKFPKSLKRKRTASFDYERIKSSKQGTRIFNTQGVSFISKASPYMDQGKLLCIPCQLSYTKLSKLLWHMSAHFSWFRFQCSRCSFISFNKLDCENHARRNHNVKKKSIQSVVLPIPNWKTMLMAHDFCMLKDDNDLSGKHTDEIISGIQEDITTENVRNGKDNESINDWDNLFVDIKSLDSDPDNYWDYTSNHSSIKEDGINIGIDIVDEMNDSHQIEVPQEIYTLDVSEIINGVNEREEDRLNFASHVKIEKIDNNDVHHESYYIPEENNDKVINRIKTEVVSDQEIDGELLNCKNNECAIEPDSDLKKNPDVILNIRPTRNRIRSIKTLQDDFFYDLSKVIKLNDNSSKPSVQKHKKSNPTTSQKATKDSTSSNSKNETKPLRVYSKKKLNK